VTGARLPAHVEVASILRRVATAGDFATVMRKGDEDRGSLLLVVLSFILLAHFSGAPPGSTYIPAHMENGKFVPGVEK